MNRILKKIKYLFCSQLIEKNAWYKQLFGDCEKFWKGFPFNLDMVNLGSSSAFYGFNYSGITIKAANWAVRPQSFPQDFAILKTYYSFLGPRAITVIALCPYSSCFKSYKDIELEKFYTVLHPGVIENFSIATQRRVYEDKRTPWKHHKMQLLKGALKQMKAFLLKSEKPESYTYQPMTPQQLKKDATGWINGWKKQFQITDMNALIPQHIREGRKKRVEILREMLTFCRERELRAVIVLPPVTSYLAAEFSETFRQNYIYSFLEETGLGNVPFLNYLDDNRFNEKDFFNSFFLNRKGARKFTQIVYEDILNLGK